MPDNNNTPKKDDDSFDFDFHGKLKGVEKKLEEFHHETLAEIKEFRRRFDKRYHLLYIFVAFIGLTLVWYAIWTIVSEIPVISNPYVAGVLGFAILLLLGKFFDRIV